MRTSVIAASWRIIAREVTGHGVTRTAWTIGSAPRPAP